MFKVTLSQKAGKILKFQKMVMHEAVKIQKFQKMVMHEQNI